MLPIMSISMGCSRPFGCSHFRFFFAKMSLVFVCMHTEFQHAVFLRNIKLTLLKSTYLSQLARSVRREFCAPDTFVQFFVKDGAPVPCERQQKCRNSSRTTFPHGDVEKEYKCHSKINIAAKELVVLDEVIISKQCFKKKMH